MSALVNQEQDLKQPLIEIDFEYEHDDGAGDNNNHSRNKQSSVGQFKETPLPKAQLLVLCMIQFNEGFQQAVIWPMIPRMVDDYVVQSEGNTDSVGFLVGILAAAFFMSQFLSSFFWGWLSDKVGRRPVLLLGTLGSCFAIGFLGFAPTYTTALLCRLSSGLLNGNIGVVKSYLAEVTDSTNQVQGFSLIAFTYGASVVVAPMVGGYMTDLWILYPYAVPCLVCTATAAVSLIIGVFCLPETQKFLDRRFQAVAGEVEEISFHWTQVLKSRDVVTTTSIYGLIAMIFVAFDELLPIICEATMAEGGFAFTVGQVGSLLTIQGVTLLIFQLLIYPYLTKRFGFIRKLRYALFVAMILNIGFPFLTGINSEKLLWICLFASMILKQIHSAIAFTDIIVCVNNSCNPDNLGIVNGMGQSFASLARTIGPLTAGYLWSVAETNHAAYIPYIFTAGLCVLTLVISSTLNPNLEYTRK